MIKIIWYNFIRFVFVIFIQIALINNIQVNSYLNAYIYVLFILLLPFETPKWLMLILAFFTGLTMDFF